MFRAIVVLAVILIATVSGNAAVQTKTVTYKHGNVECKGFLAWDDSVQGPRPGVLVLHEWWGLNDYAKDRAKQLAKLGYIAFAADMYGNGKNTKHPREATAMVSQVRKNVQDWRARAEEALAVLKSQPECDKTKLAAIGYCFGGSTALQLAYSGADLKAVATFHAALPAPTEEDVSHIKPVILVCHGAADTFVPEAMIKKFREALDKTHVKYEFVAYPEAVHSFTVPEADEQNLPGMKYDKAADKDSWKRMQELFKEQFGK